MIVLHFINKDNFYQSIKSLLDKFIKRGRYFSFILIHFEQDLSHLNQFHYFEKFVLSLIWKKNFIFSIHSLDLIINSNISSFLIGASNGLFRKQNNLDVIITDQDENFLLQSSQLKNELQLTTADLRFIQLFEDSQTGLISIHANNSSFLSLENGLKSEEEIRRLFLNYFV
jgi:hypothetical protein